MMIKDVVFFQLVFLPNFLVSILAGLPWQTRFLFDLFSLSIFNLCLVRAMQDIKIKLNTVKNINKLKQFTEFKVYNYFSSHAHVTGDSLNTE